MFDLVLGVIGWYLLRGMFHACIQQDDIAIIVLGNQVRMHDRPPNGFDEFEPLLDVERKPDKKWG